MITPESTIDDEIKFIETKINQYLDVIRVNEKGERCKIWIGWIETWNSEIIELKKKQIKEKS